MRRGPGVAPPRGADGIWHSFKDTLGRRRQRGLWGRFRGRPFTGAARLLCHAKVWSVTYLKVWKESMAGNQKISGKYEEPTLEVKYLTSTQRILKERLDGELTLPLPPPRILIESGGGWPDPGGGDRLIESGGGWPDPGRGIG